MTRDFNNLIAVVDADSKAKHSETNPARCIIMGEVFHRQVTECGIDWTGSWIGDDRWGEVIIQSKHSKNSVSGVQNKSYFGCLLLREYLLDIDIIVPSNISSMVKKKRESFNVRKC